MLQLSIKLNVMTSSFPDVVWVINVVVQYSEFLISNDPDLNTKTALHTGHYCNFEKRFMVVLASQNCFRICVIDFSCDWWDNVYNADTKLEHTIMQFSCYTE